MINVRAKLPRSPTAPAHLPFLASLPLRVYTEHLTRMEGKLRPSLLLAEIGVGITGFGVFFILFGMLLYFDSVLLAFGNVSPPALGTYPGWPGGPAPSSFRS